MRHRVPPATNDPSHGSLRSRGTDERYVDGRYAEINPDWHEGDAGWKAMHVHRILTANVINPTSICDIGCGTGAVLEHLSALFPEAVRMVGYEPSGHALAIAPESRNASVTLVQGDGLSDGDRFDLLLMLDVFEHVEDYLGLLRRSGKKATFAIFHIPLDVSIQAVLRATPFLKARERIGHLHYFTRETALATLRYVGFEILDERFTAGALELSLPGWGARLARMPRAALWKASPRWAARAFGGFSLLVLARSAADSQLNIHDSLSP